MKSYKEKDLEDVVEEFLVNEGGYRLGDNKDYDTNHALFPKDVFEFIKNTQANIWQRIEIQFKERAEEELIKHLSQQLDIRGSLDVLRNGFRIANKTIKMAYFAPNSRLNETAQQQYKANIVKMTRQVTTEQDERIDVVISVNGIPVVTMELKNESTGTTVKDAIAQYRKYRHPQGKLFNFKTRALVHFAVDSSEVYMTTKLDGENTLFLPFNRGYQHGKGNPPIEDDVKTSYLWREILEKDSLIDIIGRFLHLQEEKTAKSAQPIEKMLFPRFHQIDAVRQLTAHAKLHGAGKNYLVQHSAGSGKSNTIAWLAYHLSALHDNNNEKIFNSVIVVTDRVVLDRQLQDTVKQFEQTKNSVKKIDKDTNQLVQAIAGNVPIIITTLQKFPYIMNNLGNRAKRGEKVLFDTTNKRFAIIVDEAHSSQSGERANELKGILNKDEIEKKILAELMNLDEEEYLSEAEKNTLREQYKRQRQDNLSFFAFTATPKPITMTLFDEKNKQGETPFHSYTMKQAIEEGYILDVLNNYIVYKQYFNLISTSLNPEELELPKKQAKKALMLLVKKHPKTIEEKVAIIVEHLNDSTRYKIGGRAKAMLVTDSREDAVRYKLAIDQYIQNQHYHHLKTLVAFSGMVKLDDTEYSEVQMNNGIKETELPARFANADYQLLIVAEKYQTGFDQPLLHTMFVDKKLSGVKAVQTLSRLNRTAKGKENTFVLDFVNEHEDIYQAFKPYYEITEIENTLRDTTQLEKFAYELDKWGIYEPNDIKEFVNIWYQPQEELNTTQYKKLNALIDKAVENYNKILGNDKEKEEKQYQFKSTCSNYIKLYSLLAQILPFIDLKHEQRHTYLKSLLMKLPSDTIEAINLEGKVELEYYRVEQIQAGKIQLNDGEKADPQTLTTPTNTKKPETTSEALDVLIKELNDNYGTDFDDSDKVLLEEIIQKSQKDTKIINTVKNNSFDAFREYYIAEKKFDDIAKKLVGKFTDQFTELFTRKELKNKIIPMLADRIYRNIHEQEQNQIRH